MASTLSGAVQTVDEDRNEYNESEFSGDQLNDLVETQMDGNSDQYIIFYCYIFKFKQSFYINLYKNGQH